MKIAMIGTLRGVGDALHDLHVHIVRKMSMPYGDGERSNMICASSDVLPQLMGLEKVIDEALFKVQRSVEASQEPDLEIVSPM